MSSADWDSQVVPGSGSSSSLVAGSGNQSRSVCPLKQRVENDTPTPNPLRPSVARSVLLPLEELQPEGLVQSLASSVLFFFSSSEGLRADAAQFCWLQCNCTCAIVTFKLTYLENAASSGFQMVPLTSLLFFFFIYLCFCSLKASVCASCTPSKPALQ